MISRLRLGQLAFDHLAAAGVPVASPASALVPTTFDDAHALGGLLAAVHTAFDDLVLVGDDDPSLWTLSPAMLVGHSDGWLRRGLHGSDDDLDVLLEWRAAALDRLPTGDPDGLCHGEVYPASCRYTPADALAIAELGWVAPGHREYDLATFLWVLTVHVPASAAERFDAFVDGYAAHRPPPVSDALRAWVAARHLWSLRLAVGFEGRSQLVRRADFARAWPLD